MILLLENHWRLYRFYGSYFVEVHETSQLCDCKHVNKKSFSVVFALARQHREKRSLVTVKQKYYHRGYIKINSDTT